MPHFRLAILVVCLIVPAVARAADGSVHLYLQPLPSEAAGLTFTIASISAVTAGGSEHPLSVNLKTVSVGEVGRQRLLASGRVPIGSYTGFIVKLKQAALKGERGEAPLTVPDTPTRLDVPFVVAGTRAPLFWLTLQYQASTAGQSTFTPAFSAIAPARPIADHSGFVTNSDSNTITVFDKHVMQAVGAIDTCAGPSGMALDQARRRAYVACSKDDEIQSIDIASGEIVDRTRMSPGDRPRELALTPDGLTLVSVNGGSNSITFFDAVSLTRQERVNVGSGPSSIAIDATGRRAFVFNTLSNSLSVIDIASHALVATAATESAPLRGRFDRRGTRIYVIHDRSPYMTVLDPQQLTVVTRARVRVGIVAIEVDNVRDMVCLAGKSDTSVEFYDPNALMPLYAMKTGAGVSFLKIDAEDNSLYMVAPDARRVIVGRLADRKVHAEFDVGDAPYWVAVMGEK